MALPTAPLVAPPDWPLRRLADLAGLAHLPCPPQARQRLAGANTPAERDALLGRSLKPQA